MLGSLFIDWTAKSFEKHQWHYHSLKKFEYDWLLQGYSALENVSQSLLKSKNFKC